MFAILDTNHLRELVSHTSLPGRRMRDRIEAAKAEVFAGIVVVGGFALENGGEGLLKGGMQ